MDLRRTTAAGAPAPGTEARELVVLTCVDGALRETAQGSCADLRRSIAQLTERGVSVILVSHHRAGELRTVQAELGLRAPLIAANGAALHVPRDYFPRIPQMAAVAGPGWDVIDFVPPSIEDAIERLLWLYRLSGSSPLLVGVGCHWRDHLLLRHVDVPVVVRSAAVDQDDLRARFPDAYLTTTTGPAGWSEAIFGTC